MKNLRYWIYPLLFFTWVAASSAEELPVVAIAEFESGMGTYQSQLFASNLASQAQAAMANSDAMRLVVRAQLELAATELALEPYLSPRVGESLAVGRWVGADLIMLGTLDRCEEGLWNLELEVVDTIEADVLATTTFPLSRDPAQKPALDSEAFTPIGVGLIKEALAAQARNGEANLVLSPLFFDFIGRLRNLEPLSEDFFRELHAQVEANKGVRLLRFPRVQHVQHEMEIRLDGLTEMARHRPTRTPIFFWGDIEEVEAEGKEPDEVPLRARVNIRANHGEQREIVLTGKVGYAPALMKELVHSVVDAAKQLSQAPMTAPGPNPVEGEKLRAHAQRLRNEFQMLRETFSAVGKPERVEALLAMLDRATPVESTMPKDLRFMVRRPDILPPELDDVPRLVASGVVLSVIDALHFDGMSLWVAAGSGRGSTTNQMWRRRIVNTSRSNKLFRLDPGHTALEKIDLELPSKICALDSGNHHLWAGTQTHGILQLGRESGSLIRSLDIPEGLPTRHVFSLDATGNTVTAGGGDRHRGHLFQISDGSDGVINQSVPGWREDIAKSQFGEITILLHAHDRKLAVAGGAQAMLWKDGGEDAHNLTNTVFGGDSRFGASPQNGTVIAVTHDAQGWWLGTDAGLARLAPDGTLLQRWNTPVGGYFFNQNGWVPSMRSSGALRKNFDYNTRLAGAVTALAADGDHLFAAVTTEADEFLRSALERAYLFVMHIPSGKWVGRVELPARATAMAQDDARLWVGHAGPSAVLLEFNKSALTSVPPDRHVADVPSPGELETALGKLTIREQACHAFFRGDYQKVVDLLGGLPMESASLGELFLIAFSNDENGRSQPDVAHAYFNEILRRQPHSFWRAEAEQGLKSLGLDSRNPEP